MTIKIIVGRTYAALVDRDRLMAVLGRRRVMLIENRIARESWEIERLALNSGLVDGPVDVCLEFDE